MSDQSRTGPADGNNGLEGRVSEPRVGLVVESDGVGSNCGETETVATVKPGVGGIGRVHNWAGFGRRRGFNFHGVFFLSLFFFFLWAFISSTSLGPQGAPAKG